MNAIEWIRFIVGGSLLLCGLAVFILEVIGVFKFKYVLNRMHAAAMGDTLGIGFSIIGLLVIGGINITSLKLVATLVFLWFSSPAASHLVARLEVFTDEKKSRHYEMSNLTTGEVIPMEGAEKTDKVEEEEE
ncbi:MAG: monovalent cation/H(+) antiporter subunit G [Acetatifactor sp.]|nr:monovalent cation/H(+) antiporter subunit G [Acetatifactor sp.]